MAGEEIQKAGSPVGPGAQDTAGSEAVATEAAVAEATIVATPATEAAPAAATSVAPAATATRKRNLVSTNELAGTRVIGGKKGTKRIGKVRYFVFSPTGKRCVGFIVKRPDLLWMFHRKPMFVSIEGYDMEDGRVRVHSDAQATDKAACKALGVDYDECVLWVGLPVMCEDGTSFGTVGNVTFDRYTGEVDSFETDDGATSNALLGKKTVPANMIRGFKRGMGAALSTVTNQGAEAEENPELGALLVSDAVKQVASEGGVAEKAGQATAVATAKVKQTVDKAKPVASKAAAATGKAVNKGAYATGRQIARSKNMFSDFKKEYDKARRGE